MNGKSNGEIIGFKVPGKALILLCHVDDYICQRIGITIEILLLQAGLDEGVEGRKSWIIRNGPVGRKLSTGMKAFGSS